MKNKKIFIALIIILLIIIVIIYKNPKKEVNINNNNNIPTEQEELIVSNSFETKVSNPDDAYVKFDVKYPYFKNADADFNKSIEELLTDQMEEHKKISRENWQARFDTQTEGDNVAKAPTGDKDKFSFYSDYTVVQSNSTYISFVIMYGGYSGGAHGYENKVSFNYDIKNQKYITLKEVFSNNGDYLNYLSEQSRKSLKKTFATISENDREQATEEELKEIVDNIIASIDSGTEPKLENFSVFTFTKDKVKIYFGQYQVGPYALGSPEVEIDIK